jgi:hypothetical protein
MMTSQCVTRFHFRFDWKKLGKTELILTGLFTARKLLKGSLIITKVRQDNRRCDYVIIHPNANECKHN